MKNILALDLGNQTGWALKQSTTIDSGSRVLTVGLNNATGKKFHLFECFLKEFDNFDLTAIYYEDVRRHNGLFAARAYGGYLAILQMWAHKRNIECNGVGVGQIKKFWTGNGRAKKEDMIKKANDMGFETDNDNQVDAIALLNYVLDNKKPAEAGV